ncbi:ABC transporter substrate-binding protein [Balneatrix alpica]|uniref:ABC transporter substrate-binding protein n=1 Tax=Balneatrix alpica TaxID=75684 RepID=A0ABV5Z9B0_9GAMM|nr:ABC transporter substrate binding protein [Balneatrix alpica]
MSVKYGWLCGLAMALVWLVQPVQAAPARILYVDSYHPGYAWSDGILAGLRQQLAGADVELVVHYMDTKRNRSQPEMISAGQIAQEAAQAIKPDLIIACDDNAAQYFIRPYYADGPIPVLFCGLNWDASQYGFPTPYVTGMVEVELLDSLLRLLQEEAKGSRIGFLSVDSSTDRKKLHWMVEQMGIQFTQVALVNEYQELKQAYQQMQQQVDVLFFSNQEGIRGWDGQDFKHWVATTTKVPVGTVNEWLKEYCLLSLVKVPEEQGQWVGQTSLRVLAGHPISSIAPVTNKLGNLWLNMALAEQLGIVFKPALLAWGQVVPMADTP